MPCVESVRSVDGSARSARRGQASDRGGGGGDRLTSVSEKSRSQSDVSAAAPLSLEGSNGGPEAGGGDKPRKDPDKAYQIEGLLPAPPTKPLSG